MNAKKNKSLASQLTHRIIAVYVGLAVLIALLQLLFIEMGAVQFNIGMVFIALVTSTAGLWIIISFFTNRLLVRPLKQFAEQINSPKPDWLDIGVAHSQELVDLSDAFSEMTQAVASKQQALQNEVADAVNLAKSAFLAAAGHDLRQPMHALNLYLTSLKELEMSAAAKACVSNVSKCAKAMNDMLDTLLEIANIDSGATQARNSIFPIASPMDRILAEFEPLAGAKGLTLHVVRCSVLVNSDEEIVERLLRLLVSNALRYTSEGKILIGCRRKGNQLRVAVMDTGVGIAFDKQQAIFEEHVQLDNYERNRAKGLGLGLTIAQRLARLLKTSITLQSQPGIGSMFAFDLPQIGLDAIKPYEPVGQRRIRTQKQPADMTILLIDDEPLIIDATSMVLESWGYTVHTANSGQSAIDRIARIGRLPDIIICDYLLGDGENGVSIITMLRATYNNDIPAFLVTGITLPEHIAEIRASGMTYLYKPLDQAKLKDAIEQFTYV